MARLPEITFQIPHRDFYQHYTVAGKRLLGDPGPRWLRNNWRETVYYLDHLRRRPSLSLGTTGCGKTEGMIATAFTDACKGRPVLFADGKCEMATLTKLYYYNHLVAGRPFYAILPAAGIDGSSVSWNPLLTQDISATALMESVINSYAPPRKGEHRGEDYFTDTGRAVWREIWSCLVSTGYAVNFDDMIILLKNPECYELLSPLIKTQAEGRLSALIQRRNGDLKEVKKCVSGLVNWLEKFGHWSLNSYNPTVELDALTRSDATIYFGLPLNLERDVMSFLGKLLLNQMRLLSSRSQVRDRLVRREVACFFDECGAFMDDTTADWACQVRSSGFLLWFGVQTLADLEEISKTFATRMRVNSPNLWTYNPRDLATARMVAGLCGTEWRDFVSTQTVAGEDSGRASVRGEASLKIPAEQLLKLRAGQCLYLPAQVTDTPFYLASSYLPDPPDDVVYHRCFSREPARHKGLYMRERYLTAKSRGMFRPQRHP